MHKAPDALRIVTLLYFLSCVPFIALTRLAGRDPMALLPVSTLGSAIGWVIAATVMGWWRRGKYDRDALLGAVASLAIMFASTVAYAQHGTTLLLPLLIMQGGMLLVCDAIDRLRRRPMERDARWTLGFVAAGVAIGTWPKIAEAAGFVVAPPGAGSAGLVLMACAGCYIAGYAGKLTALDDRKGDLSFLVGDMTLTAALSVPAACVVAAIGGADLAHVRVCAGDWRAWGAGAASQGAGLFSVMIYLHKRPHTICVPLGRASKVAAGLFAAVIVALATVRPWTWAQLRPALPSVWEVVGAGALVPALWFGLRGKAAEKAA